MDIQYDFSRDLNQLYHIHPPAPHLNRRDHGLNTSDAISQSGLRQASALALLDQQLN